MSKVQAARTEETRTEESFLIETMSLADLPKVVELEESCQLSRWGYDAYLEELGRTDVLLLIARENEGDKLKGANREMIGFVAARLSLDEMHINNIAVAASVRRRGVAGALLIRVAIEGVARGARLISLEVRESNMTAQKLYQAYNFKTVGVRKNYYKNPVENALLMSAQLEKNGLIRV